ncbi:SEC14-like protein 1 [Corticium candelabrum]|uniref:SEC14-like protein 1 n=1 Tax=Corticium candelabrum TaxID=121492 RepID=UPI002E36BE98|nr:SEC14-like protein 1 [Corticium candelabrum]
MDVKGLLKSVGEGGLLKHLIAVEEDGLRRTKETTMSTGKPTCTWTCICDLEGLSMRHLWRPGLKAVHRMMEVLKDNYPETLSHLLIVRAPRIFPVLWALVHPFIDPNTRQKIVIYGGNDHQHSVGGLADYIPRGCIPDFLGGPSKCDIPAGGLVPKSLYRRFMEEENAKAFEAFYESASVSKGNPKQVGVSVEAPESVITWDFDVITGDVAFSLFHSTPESQQLSRSFSYLNNPDHPPIIDIESAEPVQEMLVVHEGQSVQGSHVCAKAGLYIMQWVFTVTPTPPGGPTHRHRHKASIMFCHDVIGSEDFRGSVSSLESCEAAAASIARNSPHGKKRGHIASTRTRTIATQTDCSPSEMKRSTIV